MKNCRANALVDFHTAGRFFVLGGSRGGDFGFADFCFGAGGALGVARGRGRFAFTVCHVSSSWAARFRSASAARSLARCVSRL